VKLAAPGRSTSRTVALRASLVWHDEVMEDVVLEKPAAVTLGASGTPTFVTPELGLPAKFAILKPGNRGYLLTLGENMRGTICVDGKQQDVADFLRRAGDDDSRGGFRATPISGRDWGVVELDASGDYKLFFQFVPLDDAQPFFTKPVILAAIGGYLAAIAVLSVLFYIKGFDTGGAFKISGAGITHRVPYQWTLFDSALLYQIAEAAARAALLVSCALGIAAVSWWVYRQEGEQQASFAFSLLVHAPLVFATYYMVEKHDHLVWPGPTDMTGTYIIARNEETKVEPEKKTATLAEKAEPAAATPEKAKNTATKGDEGKSGGEGKVERARTPNPSKDKAPPRVGFFEDKNRKVIDNVINRQMTMDYGSFAGMQGETRRGDIGFGPGKGTGVGPGEGTGTTRGSKKGGSGGGGNSDNDFVSNKGKPDTGTMRPGGGNCATPPCGVSPKLVAVSAGDIGGNFEGLTAEEINKEIRKRASAFRACYQRELNRQPGLAGKLVMHFSISGDGAVKSSRTVGGSTLRNDAIEQCVGGILSTIHFRATGGVSNVNYPFVFSQGGG
jgi:hypothetical protein